MTLEQYLYPTQEELFQLLLKAHKSCLSKPKQYILVQGDAPVLLIAHLDTVHPTPVKTICQSSDGTILMSPEGIGGDDRCGVYTLESVYEKARVKPWLLFTCDEEIGGLGANAFADDYEKNLLPDELKSVKLIIESDRNGTNDAVYYNCSNPELEEYITSQGFKTEYGSFSDISIIAPVMGIAAVNLSSGYHNAHTLHEYINRKEVETAILKIIAITEESVKDSFPVYEYKEKPVTNIYSMVRNFTPFPEIPADLDFMYADKYQMLLDIYPQAELERVRRQYGDEIIDTLYEEECGDTEAYYSSITTTQS